MGKDLTEARDDAYAKIADVKLPGGHFRKDIGLGAVEGSHLNSLTRSFGGPVNFLFIGPFFMENQRFLEVTHEYGLLVRFLPVYLSAGVTGKRRAHLSIRAGSNERHARNQFHALA